MNRLLFFLSSIILFISCASFRDFENKENLKILTKENLELLNGSYANTSRIPTINDYEDIFSDKRRKEEVIGEYYSLVKVIDHKSIRVDICKGDTIKNTFKLRGKIKNGYFELRRKYFFLPAILVTGYSSAKFRIGVLKDNTLVTDSKNISFGLVYFVYPYSEVTEKADVKHKRID